MPPTVRLTLLSAIAVQLTFLECSTLSHSHAAAADSVQLCTDPPAVLCLAHRTNERTNERQPNSPQLSVRATVEFVYTAVCALFAVRCFLLFVVMGVLYCLAPARVHYDVTRRA